MLLCILSHFEESCSIKYQGKYLFMRKNKCQFSVSIWVVDKVFIHMLNAGPRMGQLLGWLYKKSLSLTFHGISLAYNIDRGVFNRFCGILPCLLATIWCTFWRWPLASTIPAKNQFQWDAPHTFASKSSISCLVVIFLWGKGDIC